MKGAFFCEYFDSPNDALYFSIGYSFELKRPTPIWIVIEPVLSYYHQGRESLLDLFKLHNYFCRSSMAKS